VRTWGQPHRGASGRPHRRRPPPRLVSGA
jgi:hypothetical protein